MMSSNILSRFLPPTGSPSVYEAIRQNDAESDTSDVEERAGLALDDGPEEQLSDRELQDAMADATESQMASPSTPFLSHEPSERQRHERAASRPSRWSHNSPDVEADERDDDVPPSLLIEGQQDDEAAKSRLPPPPRPSLQRKDSDSVPPASGPSTRVHRPRWDTTRTQQPNNRNNRQRSPASKWSVGQHPSLAAVDPKEKAMWRWANVENLDNFLKDAYAYYLGNGIWSILLSRALNLLTLAFVVGFSVFLTCCIDYRSVRGSRKLDDILIQQCTTKMSTSSTILLWLFTFFWIGKLFQFLVDIRRLRIMHDFFFYLLGVSDAEVQTISWQEVVSRLMNLRDANPATAGAVSAKHRKFMGSQSKQRMDAHDIANRLMRKENYLIALINKDILDLTLPIPFLRNRQLFSRTLEWNIQLCVLDYVFNDQGQVRTLFLRDTHRRALSDGLRRRFIFAGLMNIFMSPFLVVYFLMHYFFRYFNEYKREPTQIGSRQYTPLAEWKFREFNELWHLFERRINMSYPYASRYLDQFPKDKLVQGARFVAFVSGAVASVLALASLVDPELFLGFEVTQDRTVLFYLGVFGSVWAVARGMVPEETNVFDPECALLEVIDYTHYFPTFWKGRLHSDEVRREFAMLYQMKIVIFLEEILSMIFTPFVLWFSLPKCSDRLIDFFREFTVHVDGMGYLCSFAVFDFKKDANTIPHHRRHDPTKQDPRADYFSTKDGKMLASYYGFLDNYGANNRTGTSPNPGRRPFHPPPAFPTLQASTSGAEVLNAANRINDPPSQARRMSPMGSMPIGQQSMAASRFGNPGMGENSAMAPSILLDPHHQPSASGFRTASRAPAYRRNRSSHPYRAVAEDEEESDSPSPGKQVPGSSSNAMGTSQSNLGESWRVNLMANDEDSDNAGEGEENVDSVVRGAGVLGLIQQFQKANTNSNRGRASVKI